MNKLQTKEFIPIGISIVLVLISIGNVLITNTVLNKAHYFGFILLLLSSILFFRNKYLYRYLFGSTILLGFIGLINFFYLTITVGFGVFQVNLLYLILLLLFITTDELILEKLFPKQQLGNETNKTNQKELEKKVNSFKQQFQNKTESELTKIVTETSSYTEIARIAAVQVLKEKTK
ncbi:hypothetical protein [uncultured Tenacibaculum sp.]|uniref:hypothetical protein n=1 Tax=uncultured Tenacibaculum sp. TaxID=174713 RepID=UPI00261B534A|nr:hypothetical protein [uncultured Tenacibaculum sp.]